MDTTDLWSELRNDTHEKLDDEGRRRADDVRRLEARVGALEADSARTRQERDEAQRLLADAHLPYRSDAPVRVFVPTWSWLMSVSHGTVNPGCLFAVVVLLVLFLPGAIGRMARPYVTETAPVTSSTR